MSTKCSPTALEFLLVFSGYIVTLIGYCL